MNMLALLFLCKRKGYVMTEKITNEQLNYYIDVFKTNRQNDPNLYRWNTAKNSDYLIYFFQNDTVFLKNFLESVITDDIYCEDDENDLKADIKDLDFNNLKIFKKFNDEIIQIESDNFICIIENQFVIPHLDNKQVSIRHYAEQRKEILNKTDNKYKFFIKLNNEHFKQTDDKDFLSKELKEYFAGYYNAWFGRNVLKPFKKIADNTNIKLKNEIRENLNIYCNFLEETTLEFQGKIWNEIIKQVQNLVEKLKIKGLNAEYNYYNAIVKLNSTDIKYPDEYLSMN